MNKVAQLDAKEFERLYKELSMLKMKRSGAKTLPPNESKLLQALNEGFPSEQWSRLKALDEKLEYGKLTKKEESELLRLSEEYEAATVLRLKLLINLASLRNTTVEALTIELGITPDYHA